MVLNFEQLGPDCLAILYDHFLTILFSYILYWSQTVTALKS